MISNPLNLYLYVKLAASAVFTIVCIGGGIYILWQYIKSKY